MTVLHAYPNKDPPERALYGCGEPKIVFFGGTPCPRRGLHAQGALSSFLIKGLVEPSEPVLLGVFGPLELFYWIIHKSRPHVLCTTFCYQCTVMDDHQENRDFIPAQVS